MLAFVAAAESSATPARIGGRKTMVDGGSWRVYSHHFYVVFFCHIEIHVGISTTIHHPQLIPGQASIRAPRLRQMQGIPNTSAICMLVDTVRGQSGRERLL